MIPRLGALIGRLKLVAHNLLTVIKLNCRSLISILPGRAVRMSYHATKEYLCAIVTRYQKSDKKRKTILLNEAQEVTKLSRKQLIRLLNQPLKILTKKKPSGRKPKYPPELLRPHIEYLWIQMEKISSRRMKEALSEWLRFYHPVGFQLETRLALEQISAGTLERFLRSIRRTQAATKGLCSTSPARFMKNKIPLNTFDAKINRPGFTQADTVAHCGTTLVGAFANSLTLTDIHSAWTENRAIFTKKALEVRRQFVDIKLNLPFDLLAVNTDSGSEFLNTPVFDFMIQGDKPVTFTRSRPYHKNDNSYVEQKNFTHVRELFGYERIEDPALIPLMNDIYKTCWNPLQNFFLPTFKMIEKRRVGAKIVKKYDKPKTPYQRLIESQELTEEKKKKLREMKKTLNPFELKAELEKKLKVFFTELKKLKIRDAA
jgi:hypothetical protein